MPGTQLAAQGLKRLRIFSKHNADQPQPRSLEAIVSSLENETATKTPFSITKLTGILERCKKEQHVTCALRLRTYLGKKGLEHHELLGNYLVSLLAEVGRMHDAQQVFDRLITRSECSWNSLIKGYDRCGNSQHALSLYEKMQDDCVPPSGYTFVPLLKACVKLKDLQRAQDLHEDLRRKGLETNFFVGNTLVHVYACFGLLQKAQAVFDELPKRNVVSWTSLISGYAKCGHGKEALNCFDEMKREGLSPDAATYACTIKACGILRDIDKGQELHNVISRQSLQKNTVIANALIDMYAKCGLLSKSKEIFEKMKVKDVVAWTSLISGLVQHNKCEEALQYFELMQCKGIQADAATYVCGLKACGLLGALDQGLDMHAEIARKKWEAMNLVGNTLVNMYANCGLPKRAHDAFDRISNKDVVSWTALIAGYANHGHGKEALICFEEMQRAGIEPEPSTYVCVIKACGNIGAADKGKEMHAAIKRKCLESNLLVGNALIDMYVKCSLLSNAQKVFDKLAIRDVISWTSLILGYSHRGKSERVIYFFEKMKEDGVIPNLVTFLSVLHACSHAGLVDQGLLYFEAMTKDYALTPALEHCSCIVDILSRAGQLEKALSLIQKMPVPPTLVIWDSLLAACRKWKNLEIGKGAFENALRFKERSAAAYITMANIFTDAGLQKEANKVKAMMLQSGALENV